MSMNVRFAQPASRSFRSVLGPLAIAILVSGCAATPDDGGTGGAQSTGGADGNGTGGAPNPNGSGGEAPDVIHGPTYDVTAHDEVPEALRQAVATASSLDGPGLLAAYPPPAAEPLDYDPLTATGLDLIQASSLTLNEAEQAVLASQGLVISTRQQFPSFAYGYKTIYGEDLPVYISADSILEAVHRSFDYLLAGVEYTVLKGELASLLSALGVSLSMAPFDAQTIQDADTYLTVALSLLGREVVAPSASADPEVVADLFDKATAASGSEVITLFGVDRTEDFSQFEPRGHYVDSADLSAYFRAMMWLGRVDFRLIETQGDTGEQVFHRNQFDAAVALHSLLQDELERFQLIDDTIGAFVGEHDNMTPNDMTSLLAALGVTTAAEAAALSDEAIVAEIASGGWGSQRIASRLIEKDASLDTLPLDRTFALFGQRYTVDSHTFSNTTYDRVPERLLPNPLEAAFTSFGNSAALPLLEPEFGNQPFVGALGATRALVDAHEAEYWEGSVYTRWLGTLRALSTVPEGAATPRTAGWQARTLSTQLGSWAELRHDTILYAKQSYTLGTVCEFPDAYVDPYPEFYQKVGELAEHVRAVVESLPSSADAFKAMARTWADDTQLVAANLEAMAENELTGAEHSQELIDFVNDAVNWDEGGGICGKTVYNNQAGWYLRLHPYGELGIVFDPTIADVHTDGENARVLHVATGMPRLMVVTANTCSGPRAYAGLAFSYGEKATENLQRLNDQDWAPMVETGPFPDVPWMSPVLAE
jgi:hypothetical protein